MSQLKKEFQEKDVQRLRNLVQGKYGEKTHSSVGFSKADDFHAEGDIWESDGRTWTIKEGIKQNITKLDKAKEVLMPLFCPSCGSVMKERLDSPIYKFFRHCFNCQCKFEMDLKLQGLWEDYKRELDNSTIDKLISISENILEDALTQSNQGYVSEAGDIQNWKGGINRELAEKNLEETVKYLKSLKK